jgi:hypothetical protein
MVDYRLMMPSFALIKIDPDWRVGLSKSADPVNFGC